MELVIEGEHSLVKVDSEEERQAEGEVDTMDECLRGLTWERRNGRLNEWIIEEIEECGR
jgi:hypothetical protein